MTTSTNENPTQAETSGAFAGGLTLVRLFMTPIIMFVIYKAWSWNQGDTERYLSLILLASVLFVIAALTDVPDDYVGGSARSMDRKFGWFDDIADSVLVSGTLIALMWVAQNAGLLHWTFFVPAVLLIARDIVIAITKGFELSKFGFIETKLGDFKSFMAMFAACVLVAATWLSTFVNSTRESNEDLLQVYGNASPLVWNIGLGALWIAAVLALVTGAEFFSKPDNVKEVD